MTEPAVHTEWQASIISRQMREANAMMEELRQERAAAAAANRAADSADARTTEARAAEAAADTRAECAEARAVEAEAALDLCQQELADVRREFAEARRWAAAAREQAAAAGRMAQHAAGYNPRSVGAADAFANGDARGQRTPAAGRPPRVQRVMSLCTVRARLPDFWPPVCEACAAPACQHEPSSLPA